MTDSHPPIIDQARLQWDEQHQPRSTSFDDIYFSADNGLQETRHVFLINNQLPERWRALTDHAVFTIAETGFGTGLNFLAAWQLWLTTAPKSAQLHFISVEKHPIHRNDLRRALALWPELSALTDQLLAQYPPTDCPGYHRMHFGKVQLTLILADAERGLAELLAIAKPGPNVRETGAHWSPFYRRNGLIDAWFFDGFAPAKNPNMWTQELFETAAKLSDVESTFATFTAAGIVKNRLLKAGFNYQKVPGFGRKRDMLNGHFEATVNVQAPPKPDSSWHLISSGSVQPCAEVTVVGGGIAGSTTAFALAERGIKVRLLEQQQIAAGASGNPQGIVYSKLSYHPGALVDFNLSSLLYAMRFYRQQQGFPNHGQACGVLQLLDNEALENAKIIMGKFARSAEFVEMLSAQEASQTAGIELLQSALWFPQSGWLNPPSLCRALLDHPNISVETGVEVTQMDFHHDAWQLDCNDDNTRSCATVVLCCAQASQRFAQTQAISTKAIRGQISYLTPTPTSTKLKTVICAEGYIAPATERHCAGATYDLHQQDDQLRQQDHRTNLHNIKLLSPDLQDLLEPDLAHGRVSYRCTTPDYLPIVGPVPRLRENIARFSGYRTNRKKTIDAPGIYHPNLYVNLGHGSKGLTYTPICAEVIASLITGQALPLPRTQLLHLHPMRFLVRNLGRNKI